MKKLVFLFILFFSFFSVFAQTENSGVVEPFDKSILFVFMMWAVFITVFLYIFSISSEKEENKVLFWTMLIIILSSFAREILLEHEASLIVITGVGIIAISLGVWLGNRQLEKNKRKTPKH